MDILAVIVNYKTADLILSCLDHLSVERKVVPGLKAVVVDNASPDASAQRLEIALSNERYSDWVEFEALSLNGGFGWGCNQAIQKALQSHTPPAAIYLINPDTRIEAGALKALVDAITADERVGAVGSQLVNENGTLAGSAFRFPSLAREWVRGHGIGRLARILGVSPTVIESDATCKADWVTGASVLIRSSALQQVGLFDTGFFLYFEETELLHRFARAGWYSLFCPASRVVHIAGASTGVVDGKAKGSRTPPNYVFLARTRYFSLTSGAWTGFLANLMWLAGSVIAVAAWVLSLGRRAKPSSKEIVKCAQLGIWPDAKLSQPSYPSWFEKPGLNPGWLSIKGYKK